MAVPQAYAGQSVWQSLEDQGSIAKRLANLKMLSPPTNWGTRSSNHPVAPPLRLWLLPKIEKDGQAPSTAFFIYFCTNSMGRKVAIKIQRQYPQGGGDLGFHISQRHRRKSIRFGWTGALRFTFFSSFFS